MEDLVLHPESNAVPQDTRPRHELQRILIAQPMSATPTDAWLPPKPHLADGTRVQVTAHVSEHGEIVERWALSDDDVRWYRLECWKARWVAIKVDRRTPIGGR